MVKWTQLFSQLLDRGISPILLRLMMFIYRNQYCDVRWNGKFSHRFPVSNGVRQGAVSSPILFCIYVDNLIKELRRKKIGCKIGGHYFGVAIYADDIFLLSASRNGLQSMVDTCQTFADNSNLKFSTNPDTVKSKTKCIVFSPKANERRGLAPIKLAGVPLPWVDDLKHLGNTVQSDNSMAIDVTQKRAKFIGKILSLNQEFHFCNPDVVMHLYNIYASSFYSSSLYDLSCVKLDQLYKTWNKTVRILYNVPLDTHSYLIETISKSLHPRVFLSSRFISFHRSNLLSSKPQVKLLANLFSSDQRTKYGRNLRTISDEIKTPCDELTKYTIKKKMTYKAVPDHQSWRTKLVDELLGARFGSLELPLSVAERDAILNFVCTS